jgi:hypothetical protein
MKKKIEIVVLLAVILGLGAYLHFRRADQVNYEVPKLGTIEAGTITAMELASGGQSVSLARKGKDWVVESSGFPADPLKVEKVLQGIRSLTLTDLVSDSKNYNRYDLGDKDRVTVKAYAGTKVLRHIHVGKAAPSSRHTFVMIPGDMNVYQAKEVFREDFQGDAASFRDRKVLSFAMDDITKVSIVKGKASVTLTRQAPRDEPGKPAIWTNAAGGEIPKGDMDLLVSNLSSLECSAFLDDLDMASLTSPEITVTLMGASEHTFSLYPKREGRTPAVTSSSSSVFTLPDYRLEGIRKAIEPMLKSK